VIFLSIAAGPEGTIYLSGRTTAGGFPTTPNALKPNPPAEANRPSLPFLATIDPSQPGEAQLTYSTYFGSAGAPGPKTYVYDYLGGMAVDKAGRFYVCGDTPSTDLPVTNSAFQTANLLSVNPLLESHHLVPGTGFFAVIDPNQSGSSQLVYSTYLGGEKGQSACLAVSVDDSGLAYLTGWTTASDFPLTRNAFQRQNRLFRSDFTNSAATAFAAVIDPQRAGPASLVYSTFLGGGHETPGSQGDLGIAIAPGPAGLIYVAGSTGETDFPVSRSAFQKKIVRSTQSGDSSNIFLTVLNPARLGAAGLVYSTYLGGNGFDEPNSVAVDALGNAYIGGGATDAAGANPFPITANAFQRGADGSFGFATISKINPFASGTASLLYSTAFGIANSAGTSPIALDPSRGFVYVAGGLGEPQGFPTTPDALQPTINPEDTSSSYLAILDPLADGNASLLYSTYLGNGAGIPYGVSADAEGRALIAGIGAALPATAGSYQSTGAAFVAIVNPPIPSDAPTLPPPPTPTPTRTPTPSPTPSRTPTRTPSPRPTSARTPGPSRTPARTPIVHIPG